MDRLIQLETEMEAAQKELDTAREKHEAAQARVDEIICQLRTLQDNWVPGATDTDYNEL